MLGLVLCNKLRHISIFPPKFISIIGTTKYYSRLTKQFKAHKEEETVSAQWWESKISIQFGIRVIYGIIYYYLDK